MKNLFILFMAAAIGNAQHGHDDTGKDAFFPMTPKVQSMKPMQLPVPRLVFHWQFLRKPAERSTSL